MDKIYIIENDKDLKEAENLKYDIYDILRQFILILTIIIHFHREVIMLKQKTTIDEMIKLLESKNIKFKLMIKKKIKKVLLQKNSNE